MIPQKPEECESEADWLQLVLHYEVRVLHNCKHRPAMSNFDQFSESEAAESRDVFIVRSQIWSIRIVSCVFELLSRTEWAP